MINLIKKYKKLGLSLLILLSVLFFIPFLIPTQTYLKKVEALATHALGVPVTIKALHFYALPTPHISLNDIVVGRDAILSLEKLDIAPSIWTIVSQTKVIDIQVKSVVIDEAMIALVENLLEAPREENGIKVHVRQIKAQEVVLIAKNMNLPKFDLQAELDIEHNLNSAELTTLDKQLTANITPIDDGSIDAQSQKIAIKFDHWALPIGAPFLIEKGVINAVLTKQALDVQEIDLGLYGGKLIGNAKLLIPQDKKTQWRLNSDLKLDNVAVKEPSRLVAGKVYISGQLFGKGKIKSDAANLGQLAKQLKAQLQFNIDNGVLHGLDLIKVASLLVSQSKASGDTAFEVFSGAVNVSNGAYFLHNLKFSSGLIAGTGQVNISPNNKLDGKGEIELKKSISLVAIPVEVSGTVSNPTVYPSKAAIAGAMAGTSLLGPGVGTSLGIKAGGAVDKIKDFFGGN
jgi:hypothetical protein